MKPRNPFVESARRRHAGAMKDRRSPRGGARNEQVALLDEAVADATAAAEGGRRVAVTGNRHLTTRDRAIVRREIRRLVADAGVAEVAFGGAIGADTEALLAAADAREGERPRLVVVVPDTLGEQPRETWDATSRADELIELRNPIRPDDRWASYHRRNRRLVERCTHLLAFWNGDERTGTSSTIRVARDRGIPVRIVEIEGGD